MACSRVLGNSKDKQQQAAAANGVICFFVRSLGEASYVVKLEHQATVARVKQHVALKSGICEDAFYLVREGRVLRDGDTLECLGVVRDTQLHMCSYLRGGVGMGRQPQIPGQWVCQSCGMGGCWPTRQSFYRCGAPRLGGKSGQRLQRESHYLGQPSNQGLPINPTNRVLSRFKVCPLGLCLRLIMVWLTRRCSSHCLQSLGLPEEVLEAVSCKDCNSKKHPRKFLGKNSFRCSGPRLTCLLSKSLG